MHYFHPRGCQIGLSFQTQGIISPPIKCILGYLLYQRWSKTRKMTKCNWCFINTIASNNQNHSYNLQWLMRRQITQYLHILGNSSASWNEHTSQKQSASNTLYTGIHGSVNHKTLKSHEKKPEHLKILVPCRSSGLEKQTNTLVGWTNCISVDSGFTYSPSNWVKTINSAQYTE